MRRHILVFPLTGTALWLLVAASIASAQSAGNLAPVTPCAATVPVAPSNGDALAEIEDLRTRLERCEAELKDRDSQRPQATLGATPASFDPTGAPPKTDLMNAKPVLPLKPFDETPAEPLPPGAVPILDHPTLNIGGKAIWDNAAFNQSPTNKKLVGQEEDLTGFRFLRVMFFGDLYENINFRLEIDLAQAQSSSNPELLAAFQDVWVNFRELPVLGNVKVGYFKEPYGLEQQTGEEYLLFMERSLANTFCPARRMGVMAYNDLREDHTLSWFTGTFREGSGDKTFLEYSDLGDWGTTTRLVWLPYYDEASGGRSLVHIGGAYEFTGANNNNTKNKVFSIIPEINAQTPFSTVTIPADDFQLYGFEAAIMNGPLLIQGEYMGSLLNPTNPNQPDIYLDGAYVEALYMLTGENHYYNLPGKFFQGVSPFEPFFRVRDQDCNVITGHGAWELGARLSYINLNNDGVGGGRAVDWTLGVHWYLTSNCSMMYNFIHSDFDRKGIDSTCEINGFRVEYHF